MFKKMALIIFVLLLVLAQARFIYALQHGGADTLNSAWYAFDVTQSSYSQFVLRTIKWWWALPVLCMLLAGVAVRKPRITFVVLALVTSIVGTIALYWSAYAPSLFIHI